MDKSSERYKELRNKKVGLTPFKIEKISEMPNQPASRSIAGILEKLGISSFDSCEEIQGGQGKQVYKVSVPGAVYALRLLPSRKGNQFAREKMMIDIAERNSVPVPKIYDIQVAEGYAAMLMEWREGQTVLSALQEQPKNAGKLGVQFGKTQARINQISVSGYKEESRSWLTPSPEEAEILSAIPDLEAVLVHLDYHPLNVLTDGTQITAVLDWANAAIGDGRFDIARTFSILELEGPKVFEKNPQVLADFAQGWKKGYEEVAGPFDQIDSLELFYAWSGVRMKRDAEARLGEIDKAHIQQWVVKWLNESVK